jgi:hypothetical protein
VGSRAAVLLPLLDTDKSEIETVLKAVEARNKVVHDAYVPNDEESQKLRSVMQSIRRIGCLDVLKSPSLSM